jgi:two-component system, chemotaxis family, protein-glutamate methylesterase/glutaminase
MPGHDVIVVGFSAGGVEALTQVVRDLPPELPAAVLIVHHFPAHSISALPRILSRVGKLRAAHAVDGERIRPGRIYVSRPERHLLVNGERIQLSRGPKENGHRPAIDPLFRTAGRSYGPRVIGVLLSGTLDDGTDGLRVIKECGGLAVVQRPEDALFGDMPSSAMELVQVDHVESAAALGPLLTRLVSGSPAVPEEGIVAMTPHPVDPPDPTARGTSDLEDHTLRGPPSPLTCPDCGGALWELQQGEVARYRCHVGHSYSDEAMLAAQSTRLESSLWAAIRSLKEKAELSRRLSTRMGSRGLHQTAQQFEKAAAAAEHDSERIRQLVLSGSADDPGDMSEAEMTEAASPRPSASSKGAR